MIKTSTMGNSSLLTEEEIANSIATEFGAAVPEIEAVAISYNPYDKLFQVWTFVPARDYELYRRIFTEEAKVINEFLDFDFDFHVTPSYGRSPETIIGDPRVQVRFSRR